MTIQPSRYLCDLIEGNMFRRHDPSSLDDDGLGDMFRRRNPSSLGDDGLSDMFQRHDPSSLDDNQQVDGQTSPFSPPLLLPPDLGTKLWVAGDSECAAGTDIVLKRIVWKLFHHVDQLQPNELDDEFIFQSVLSYNDYLNMMKHLHNSEINCASLHRLDGLLSKFISDADVRRPSQINLFSSLMINTFGRRDQLSSTVSSMLRAFWPNSYMAIVLLTVCIIAWFLNNIVGYGAWKSNLSGVALTGFIQFYMHQQSLHQVNHQERLERCDNPSYLAQVLTYLNYDYNNCQRDHRATNSNIALIFIQYFSELIFHPIVTFASKIGHASQSYLDSYSGLNQYTLAPIFLILIHLCFLSASIYFGSCLMKCIVTYCFTSKRPAKTKQKPIDSASNKRGSIKNNNSRNNSVTYNKSK